MTERTALWTRSFISVTFINVMLFFAWQLLMPTLPLFLSDIHATTSEIGISVLIATAAALLVRPFAGLMVDTLGRKWVLLGGLLILTCSVIGYRLLPYVWAILLLRFFHGIGWGIATTACTTVASDVLPEKRFGEGMGFFTISQSISLALAPGAGIAIYHAYGFTALMYSAGAMLILAFLTALISRVCSNPLPAMTPCNNTKFAPYEKASFLPALLMFCVSTPHGAVLVFISLYGKQLGIENIGLYFTFCAAALFTSRLFLGKLIDRYGYKVTLIPGFLLYSMSLILVALSHTLTGILIAAVMQGIAYASVQVSLQTMAILNAPVNRRGAASATFFTGMDGGTGFGNLAAGFLIGLLGYNGTFAVMAVPPLIGLSFYIYFLRHKPGRMQPSPQPPIEKA